MKNWLVILTAIIFNVCAQSQNIHESKMATIRSGTYVPLYSSDTLQYPVHSFQLDVYPVTNSQFLSFVLSNE
ncbi:MAG: formylglycine-generating enzyme family protein, partial [Bacteroidia bacterium]|nr:formylglycine-generating enzyme family protein [Bacteroidia bacterium]